MVLTKCNNRLHNYSCSLFREKITIIILSILGRDQAKNVHLKIPSIVTVIQNTNILELMTAVVTTCSIHIGEKLERQWHVSLNRIMKTVSIRLGLLDDLHVTMS